MDENKAKKSIDEILADLNNILSRMPDLAETIKTPDIKPIDFNSIIDEKKDAASLGLQYENDAPLRAENESNPVREEPVLNEEPKEVYEAEKNRLDQLPVEDSQEILSEQDMAEDIKKLDDENNSVSIEHTQHIQEKKDPAILETTNDFGAPDIDFLFGLAENKKNNTDEKTAEMPGDDMKEDINENNFEEESGLVNKPQETLNEEIKQEEPGESEVKREEPMGEEALNTELENLSFEAQPSLEKSGPADLQDVKEEPQTQDENKELSIDLDINRFEEGLSSDISNDKTDANVSSAGEDSAKEPAETLSLEEKNSQPLEISDNEKTVKIDLSEVSLEDLTLKPAEEKNIENKQEQTPSEDKTLVFEPSAPSADIQNEEKTVVFSPSETSRIASETQDFISVNPPESVSGDRIKNVGFIVSMDKGFLNGVLKTLDEICLASQTKPMFVRRSLLEEYTDDINLNYMSQQAAEKSCVAVIAVGEFPTEKIHEMDTVFSTGNIIFKNFNQSTFTKSDAIDFVMDLIAK